MTDLSEACSVLLVNQDVSVAEAMARQLLRAGYDVRLARSFDEAREILSSRPPDVLITDVQLGAYNGLHLVWLSQSYGRSISAIVTSAYADPVHEAEARRLGCPYILTSTPSPQFLRTVAAAAGREPKHAEDRRRWPRTAAGEGIILGVDDARATLRDVSYGGCRLSFDGPKAFEPARSVRLSLPGSDGAGVKGEPVWTTSRDRELICGVVIRGNESDEATWRRFVDDMGPGVDGAADV